MPSFAIPAAASPLTNPALDRRPRESHDDSSEHDNCAAEPQAARDRSPNDGLAPQPTITRSPSRRSGTVGCKCHSRCPYQPFPCAAYSPARKGTNGPAGPGIAGKVEATVFQTAGLYGLA